MVRQALSFERFLRCDPVDEVVALASCFPPAPWAGRGAAGLEGQRFAVVIGPVVSIACKTLAWSGQWDVAREAAARGWDGGRSSGLVHVASYREAALAEIDCLAGRLADAEAEARTARDILRDFEAVSHPDADRGCNLVVTLIARGHLDEAAELMEQWGDFSAPFSVVPLAPPLLAYPRHPSPGAWGARERSRGPARDRRGLRGDAHAQPRRDSLAPGGGAGARRARSHRRGPADRRRGREPGTRVRRRARDRHDAARQVLDRDQARARSRPCGSRSPRSSRAARRTSSPIRASSWGPRCAATASAASRASRFARRSSSPT